MATASEGSRSLTSGFIGFPAGTSPPTVDGHPGATSDGVYLMTPPLSVGTHRIHVGGEINVPDNRRCHTTERAGGLRPEHQLHDHGRPEIEPTRHTGGGRVVSGSTAAIPEGTSQL